MFQIKIYEYNRDDNELEKQPFHIMYHIFACFFIKYVLLCIAFWILNQGLQIHFKYHVFELHFFTTVTDLHLSLSMKNV